MSRSQLTQQWISDLQRDTLIACLRNETPNIHFEIEPTSLCAIYIWKQYCVGEVVVIPSPNGHDMDDFVRALDSLEDNFRQQVTAQRCPAAIRKARDFVSQRIAQRSWALALVP